MFRTPATLALLCALCPSSAPSAFGQGPAAAETPKVSRVVLYKHGVGYFERRGKVVGDASFGLSFKADQMKDVLKSLFALDLGGGRISTILYDTKDPLSKQLESILFDVPADKALTVFLTQLQGARIEATVGGQTVRGRILGIEPVIRMTDQVKMTTYKLTLLDDEGTIRPVELFEASALKFLDEPVRRDLDRILDIKLKSKYADRKTVSLRATGKGEREVRLGYILETPIWKTSYRLLFEKGEKPYLQGWAIAENPTDDDWENVDITFVAGAPISFSMDLYTAYYLRRPEVKPSAGSAAGLVSFQALEEGAGEAEAVMESDAFAAREERAAAGAAGGRARRMAKANAPMEAADMALAAPMAAAPPRPMASLANASMPTLAQGVKVGELFAYEGKEPVSIPRGKAALVPILGEKVEGDRILYYRRDVSPKPTNAALLKNDTNLTLEGGPVTVFDGSTCIGEGLLSRSLKPGEREFVSYAIETGVTVETVPNSVGRNVHKAVLANGIMSLTNFQILETTYKLRNNAKEEYTLWLDHPKQPEHKLAEGKPEETLPGHYRFKIALGAGKTVEHVVREQLEVTNQVSLYDCDVNLIAFHLSQSYLSKKAKAFLQEIQGAMAEIGNLRRAIEKNQAEQQQIGKDQERTRRNLDTFRNTPDELERRQRYLVRLDESEKRLEALRAEQEANQQKLTGLENELRKKLEAFREE